LATLDLSKLLKVFGTDVRAVDEIDLHIEHGELISLLGPSGCGKTTTLRLIAGFLDPNSGEVIVDNKVVSDGNKILPPEKRNMSMIFQSYAIWPHKTVFQNVSYGLKFRNLTNHESEKRAKKMLSVVRMEHLADRYPGELSGGQQQRVALARAIVVEPAILLLDEPLSNLDANLREEMRFEIRRLHDEFHITSVYVTHDQSEAMVTSDRICVMNDGKIEQVGKPQEIYDEPKTRFVAEFVGVTNSLEGKVISSSVFDTGSMKLKMKENQIAVPGNQGFVSIRPHRIGISSVKTDKNSENMLTGRVKRSFYFGSTVDYLVEVEGMDDLLRVIVDPVNSFQLDSEVTLEIDAESVVFVE
tara:strand:+ start:17599 stop:18669 length:1071 start_codon:yes stop_codon:yes gene_type:complete